MIAEIKREKPLLPHLRESCEDSGVSVEIDEGLSAEDYACIKVDDYYSALGLGRETPKSVDNIVAVDCVNNSYALYILEFKGVKRAKHIRSKDIIQKFTTAIDNFLKIRFSHIFCSDRYKYKSIKAYEVDTVRRENPYKRSSLPQEKALLDEEFKFRGKIIRIKRANPQDVLITRQ